jgi:hypothetical protein
VREDVEDVLRQEGLVVDRHTFAMLSERIYHHKILLLKALRRRAQGDCSKNGVVDKLPAWERPATSGRVEAEGKTLQVLLEAW